MSAETSIGNVRPLISAELSKVLLLAKSCPEAAQWTPSEFELGIGDVRGWVIGDTQILFGFLAVRVIVLAREMELLNLAVGPNWRRRGFGSVLLNTALADCRANGYQSIFLEVRESNERAIAFYKKHNFSVSGRRPNYYRNPDESALTMALHLSN
ncbi:MAG TPA: ribosomal protein S18-alanine N-acetyltransferase [Candidatus Dormibacteraeota bacterium]|jgi:ribosomal-protein-alanine acetyltransferase|nr:ribosomal protein S18-alanine N-acetyltransferase [Candidatus Dormibacteraeota bacterium]